MKNSNISRDSPNWTNILGRWLSCQAAKTSVAMERKSTVLAISVSLCSYVDYSTLRDTLAPNLHPPSSLDRLKHKITKALSMHPEKLVKRKIPRLTNVMVNTPKNSVMLWYLIEDVFALKINWFLIEKIENVLKKIQLPWNTPFCLSIVHLFPCVSRTKIKPDAAPSYFLAGFEWLPGW